MIEFLHTIASGIVLVAIGCRLAMLPRSIPSFKARIQWHLWVLAHVLIATGAFSWLVRYLNAGPRAITLGELALSVGGALYFSIRWQRRTQDYQAHHKQTHLGAVQ